MPDNALKCVIAKKSMTQLGLDHRVGHFRPLRIMAYVLEHLVISTVRYFCVAQKQKGVADAMIEAEIFTERSFCPTEKPCIFTR